MKNATKGQTLCCIEELALDKDKELFFWLNQINLRQSAKKGIKASGHAFRELNLSGRLLA